MTSPSPDGVSKSSRTRILESLLLSLKTTRLFHPIRSLLLSGSLLTSKRNAVLFLLYLLKAAFEVRDIAFIKFLGPQMTQFYLTVQDFYTEIVFAGKIGFQVLRAQGVGNLKKLCKRVLQRAIGHVLEIKKGFEQSFSRMRGRDRDAFTKTNRGGAVFCKNLDLPGVSVIVDFLVEIAGYVLQLSVNDIEGFKGREVVTLCEEVKQMGKDREFKGMWDRVITAWGKVLDKQKAGKAPRSEWDKGGIPASLEGIRFEKIEKFLGIEDNRQEHGILPFEERSEIENQKKDINRKHKMRYNQPNKGKNPKRQNKIRRNFNLEKDGNQAEWGVNGESELERESQRALATMVTDYVYEEDRERGSRKKRDFQIRKLKNFKIEGKSKHMDFKKKGLLKQTREFRKGRMFLKKRTGQGGGYVKGRYLKYSQIKKLRGEKHQFIY